MPPKKNASSSGQTNSYQHPGASALMRPEVGTLAQFRKKKDPVKYRYDSSLDPAARALDGKKGKGKFQQTGNV